MINKRQICSAVVTGPTGAVGSALCRHMLAAGVDVYAVVRPDSLRAGGLPQGERMHLLQCDLAELNRLPAMLKDVQTDAFFHLGWICTTGAGRNDMAAQVKNIQYTLDAVHAAHEIGCQVFVGAGSQAEYGRVEGALRADTPAFPENGYGMAKLCAGQMSAKECAKLGMAHVWTRILSVYGPRDTRDSMISSTIRKLLDGECPALTAGIQKWDFLYAADAADALYRCALSGRDGHVYPLGGGQAVPLKNYIEALRDAIDAALPLGLGHVAYAPQQVMHLEADISDLRRDTGFCPATSFDEGIRKTIEWIKGEEHGRL